MFSDIADWLSEGLRFETDHEQETVVWLWVLYYYLKSIIVMCLFT